MLAQTTVIYGQQPTSSPAPASSGAAKDAQEPKADFFHREELTGDWDGTRTKWKDKGVELASSLNQFYQGIASGGIQTGSEYNGTAQAGLDVDLGKLAGWEYWSAEIKADLRFGGPLLTGTGSISPVNTAVIIPGADGTVFALTAVNLTRLFPIDLQKSDFVAVSFGRFNLVDLLHEHFFADTAPSDSSTSRRSAR